jgi:uncharacterized protein YndB with AHSA1/START domain
MKHLIAFLIVLLAATPALAAPAVKNTSYLAPDGSRVLRHEVVVRADVAAAWQAFTTAEGWRDWAAPYATRSTAQLSTETEFETSYNPKAVAGAETNIRQRVLAYIPGRMFAFRTTQSPKGFPHPKEITHVFNVVEFEPLAKKRTRVRLSMIGFGTGDGFDGLYKFFEAGNAWSMAKYAAHFANGPIDWKKAFEKPAH